MRYSAIHLNPDQAKAPSPTAMVRQVTAPTGVSRKAARSMNTVWLMNAPQLNSFLTCDSTVLISVPIAVHIVLLEGKRAGGL
jgi:hypothetical protein